MENFIFTNTSNNTLTDHYITNYKTLTTYSNDNNNNFRSFSNIKTNESKLTSLKKKIPSNNLIYKRPPFLKSQQFIPRINIPNKRPIPNSKIKERKHKKVFSFDFDCYKTENNLGFMTRANRDTNNLLLKKNNSNSKTLSNENDFNLINTKQPETQNKSNDTNKQKLICDCKDFIKLFEKKAKALKKKNFVNEHNNTDENTFLDIAINRLLHKVSFINTKNETISEEYVMNLLKNEAKLLQHEIDNMFQRDCNIKNFSKVIKSNNNIFSKEKEDTLFFPFINSINSIPYKVLYSKQNKNVPMNSEVDDNQISKKLPSKLTALEGIQKHSPSPMELLLKRTNSLDKIGNSNNKQNDFSLHNITYNRNERSKDKSSLFSSKRGSQVYTMRIKEEQKKQFGKLLPPKKIRLTKRMKNKMDLEGNKNTLNQHDMKSTTLYSQHNSFKKCYEKLSISLDKKETINTANKINEQTKNKETQGQFDHNSKSNEENVTLPIQVTRERTLNQEMLSEINDTKDDSNKRHSILKETTQLEQELNNKISLNKIKSGKRKSNQQNKDLLNLKNKPFKSDKTENNSSCDEKDCLSNSINSFTSNNSKTKKTRTTKVAFSSGSINEQTNKKRLSKQLLRKKSSKKIQTNTPRNSSYSSSRFSRQNSTPRRNKKSYKRNSSSKPAKSQFSTKKSTENDDHNAEDTENDLSSDNSERKFMPTYKEGRVTNYLKEQQNINSLFELSHKTIGKVPTKENIDLLLKYETFVNKFKEIKEEFSNSSEYANYKVRTMSDKELIYYLLLERNNTLKSRLKNDGNLISAMLETINRQKKAKEDLIRRTCLLNRQQRVKNKSYFIEDNPTRHKNERKVLTINEHFDKTKFIQSYLSAKNEIALHKELRYHIYTTKNNTSREKFIQFLRQMENLKKLDPKNYIKQLEENYDFYREGINELLVDREKEDRINKFLFYFEMDREKSKISRNILKDKIRIKDWKPNFKVEKVSN